MKLDLAGKWNKFCFSWLISYLFTYQFISFHKVRFVKRCELSWKIDTFVFHDLISQLHFTLHFTMLLVLRKWKNFISQLFAEKVISYLFTSFHIFSHVHSHVHSYHFTIWGVRIPVVRIPQVARSAAEDERPGDGNTKNDHTADPHEFVDGLFKIS